MTEAKKKLSLDDLERILEDDGEQSLDIRPDGSVVVGEREKAAPSKLLTYRATGLGDNY